MKLNTLKNLAHATARGIAAVAVAGCATMPDRNVPTTFATAGEETIPSTNKDAEPHRGSPPITTIAERKGAAVSGAFSSMPVAPSSFGCAVAGDWLYCIGGHVGRTHEHSIENLQHEFYRVNLKSREQWEKLPGGAPLQSVALLEHGGMLYRVGGMTARNHKDDDDDTCSVAEFARFDPAAMSWTNLPSLPQPRSSADAAILDGKLYVVGGWKLEGEEKTWPSCGYVYDLKEGDKGAWKEFAAPVNRRALALVGWRKKLYAMGGLKQKGGMSSESDVCDMATGVWSKGPDLPFPGFGASAVVMNDRLYASGMDSALYRLSENGTTWERAASLMVQRFFHRLVISGANEIAVVGGARPEGHVSLIEWVNVASASPRVASMSFAYPGAAKNRHAVVVDEGTLYLFGGNTSLEQHDFEPECFTDQGYAVELATLLVKETSEFPARRQSMETIGWNGNGQTYALGGFANDGKGERTQDGIYRFDLKSKAWNTLDTKLPRPLTQFGLCEHDKKLWLFGGLDYDDNRAKEQRFIHSIAVYVVDPATVMASETKVALPRQRRAFGGAKLGDKFYMVGGMRDGFKPVDECDVYDFAAGTWGTMAAPSRTRISPSLIALNGKLWLIGGSSRGADGKSVPDRSVEAYDPASNSWKTIIESLPNALSHVHVAVWNDSFIIFSTHNDMGRFDAVIVAP